MVVAETVLVELLIGADARPGALSGGAQCAEDEVQLVLHRGSREEWPPTDHLIHDAAHTPERTGGGLVTLTTKRYSAMYGKLHFINDLI